MTFADKLAELLERATPGPWAVGTRSGRNPALIYSHTSESEYLDPAICDVYGIPLHTTIDKAAGSNGISNAEFITFLANHAAEIEALVRAAKEVDRIGIGAHLQLHEALEALDK